MLNGTFPWSDRPDRRADERVDEKLEKTLMGGYDGVGSHDDRLQPVSYKENPMSVTLIARIKAKQGSESQLEQAFHDMIKKVRAAEPGCQAYILHKANDDPTQFVWYETYADQAAFDNHRKTEHMKEMGGRIANLLDGRPQVEMLTELDRK
jgi:quinol monooxygenase YgiN